MSEKDFMIEDLSIHLAEENGGIRVTTEAGDNVILPGQDLASVESLMKGNFQIVDVYYRGNAAESIGPRDLAVVSLKIVLHYLYMYNMWRRLYTSQKDRDLTFLVQDFEHPATKDLVIQYYKEKYPETFSRICEKLLGMSAVELKEYEKRRQQWYEIW